MIYGYPSRMPRFRECETCAAKPGSPELCVGCIINRNTIELLHDELDEFHGRTRVFYQRIRETDLENMLDKGRLKVKRAYQEREVFRDLGMAILKEGMYDVASNKVVNAFAVDTTWQIQILMPKDVYKKLKNGNRKTKKGT